MNDEIERIEMTIEQAQEKVNLAVKWQELLATPLFEELVSKGYLGDDAVRLTMNLKPEAAKNEISNTMLTAKSVFSRYVANVLDEGQNAYVAVQENLEAKAEVEAEED